MTNLPSPEKGVLYELINPSDPITFIAPSYEGAVGAVLAVSNGQCCAQPSYDYYQDAAADLPEVPLFLFGGIEEWMEKRGTTLEEFFERHKSDICETLASFCTGTVSERKRIEHTLRFIDDPEKRKEFLADWDDQKRNSLNQFTNYAHTLAAQWQGEDVKDSPRAPGCVVARP